MSALAGRNDPCLCGSGKKFKKCCEKLQIVDLHAVIGEELDRVMSGFIKEGLGRKEYADMENRIRLWSSALGNTFSEATIKTVAFETYMYTERRDLWIEYLNRQIAKTHRLQVLEVLKSWKNPFWLMGKVVDQTGKVFYLQDGLSNQLYTIAGEESPMKGDWLFGVVMPDFRDGQQNLYGTNSLIFIPKRRKALIGALLENLKTFKGDVLSLYRLFDEFDEGNGFTTFEQEVLQLVSGYLQEFEMKENGMMRLVQAFLFNVNGNAKKSGAVAAGLVQAALDNGILQSKEMTQKELVAYFGVSVSTMTKYREKVGEFISLSIKNSEGTRV